MIIICSICFSSACQQGATGAARLRYEMCLAACEHDGKALEFVDDEYHNTELCRVACIQNENALKYVKLEGFEL